MNMMMRQKYQDILCRCLLFLFIGPILLVSSSKNQEKDCGNVSISDCLAKVQTALILTSLPFRTDKSEIENLCRNAVEGYNCSSNLLSRPSCLVARDRNILDNFKNMAEQNILLEDLCLIGGKRTKRDYTPSDSDIEIILKNSECFSKEKKAFKCCINILHMDGKLDMSKICCKLGNFRKCMDSQVRKYCGEDAAKSAAQMFEKFGAEKFHNFCQTMVVGQKSESCPALDAVCAASRIAVFVEFLLLMSLLFIMWMSDL